MQSEYAHAGWTLHSDGSQWSPHQQCMRISSSLVPFTDCCARAPATSPSQVLRVVHDASNKHDRDALLVLNSAGAKVRHAHASLRVCFHVVDVKWGTESEREVEGGHDSGGGVRCWWLSLVPEPGQGAGEGHPRACMRLGVGGRRCITTQSLTGLHLQLRPCPALPPPHAHPTPGPRSAFCHTPLTSDPFWRNTTIPAASACMSVCAVTQTELHVARTAGEASGPPRMGKSLWPSPFKQHPLSSTLFMRVWRLQTWHRFPGLGCAHPHACPRGA